MSATWAVVILAAMFCVTIITLVVVALRYHYKSQQAIWQRFREEGQ